VVRRDVWKLGYTEIVSHCPFNQAAVWWTSMLLANS
jgi:hypothetical protein